MNAINRLSLIHIFPLNWTLPVEANGVPTNFGFEIHSNGDKRMETPSTHKKLNFNGQGPENGVSTNSVS